MSTASHCAGGRFLKSSDALRRLWAVVLAPPAAPSQSPSPLLLPLLLPRPASVLLVRAPRLLAFKTSVCKGCSSKLGNLRSLVVGIVLPLILFLAASAGLSESIIRKRPFPNGNSESACLGHSNVGQLT